MAFFDPSTRNEPYSVACLSVAAAALDDNQERVFHMLKHDGVSLDALQQYLDMMKEAVSIEEALDTILA